MPDLRLLNSSNLNPDDVYPCPVCRFGKIAAMPLMDAMACGFCQQIFTVDFDKQQLEMPSRHPPLLWQWNGNGWSDGQVEGVELGWGYAFAAIALVLFPTTLIALVAFTKPIVADVPLSWLPMVWTGLTFFSHLAIVLWLVGEIYQVPINAYFRRSQRYLRRN